MDAGVNEDTSDSPGFFSDPDLVKLIKVAVEKINNISDSGSDERLTRLRSFTQRSLDFFWQSYNVANQNCLYSIEEFGNIFKGALRKFNVDATGDVGELEPLAVLCYQFLLELEIAYQYGLPRSLIGWTSFLKESYFLDYSNKVDFQTARNRIVIGVLRKYLHRKELVTLAELPRVIQQGEDFKRNLEKTLGDKSQVVEKLKGNLDEYERSFNFLGLNRAFRSMRALKKKEATNTLRFLVFLGVIMIAPLFVKVLFELIDSSSASAVSEVSEVRPDGGAAGPNQATDQASRERTNGAAATSVSLSEKVNVVKESKVLDGGESSKYFKKIMSFVTFFGFELVLLYFFKVTLHNYRSLKSQLLQIDLRVALTQFVLKYSEFAGNSKEAAAGTFERFEQVIFSGIVGGDSEIPSTFDGLDQVVKVLEKVRPS